MITIPSMQNQGEEEKQTGVVTLEHIKVKRPKRYQVLMHNDDYTTMEFVVLVLQTIFQKPLPEAQEIMLRIHNEGMAVCGIYTYEIAETKVEQVERMAKAKEFPLKCSIGPE